jgi:hypothetical protein
MADQPVTKTMSDSGSIHEKPVFVDPTLANNDADEGLSEEEKTKIVRRWI